MSAHLALLNRATLLLLVAAIQNDESRAQFARGSINALRSLDSEAARFAAQKDAGSAGYQPPACLQAAWAALPVDIERLSLVEVQQFLAAQGVEIASKAVTYDQINAVQQLKNSEVATINLNDEHAAHAVDLDDGSEHGQTSGLPAIVAEGGAA